MGCIVHLAIAILLSFAEASPPDRYIAGTYEMHTIANITGPEFQWESSPGIPIRVSLLGNVKRSLYVKFFYGPDFKSRYICGRYQPGCPVQEAEYPGQMQVGRGTGGGGVGAL